MGNFTKGETFAAGETVTAARLHKLIEDAEIVDGTVTTAKIADEAITADKLDPSLSLQASQVALASGKMLVGNGSNVGAPTDVDSGTMATSPSIGVKALGIAAAQLAADAVENAKIKDAAVSLPKLATQAGSTIVANATAGSASPTAVTLGTGLEFSGGALRVTTAISGGSVTKMAEQVVTLDASSEVLLNAYSHGLGGYPVHVSIALKFNFNDSTYTHYSIGDMVCGDLVLCDYSDYDVPAFYWIATSSTITVKRVERSINQSIVIPSKNDSTFQTLTTSNQPSCSIVINAWR